MAILSGLKGPEVTEKLLMRRRDIMIESAAYDLIKKEGFEEGVREGALETARKMVLEVLEERFGIVPLSLIERIRSISDETVLTALVRQAVRCGSLDEFREAIDKALS